MCNPSASRVAGSSPHVRGAQQSEHAGRVDRGIIPACAGSTVKSKTYRHQERDHPRMCGEHRASAAHVRLRLGSSPHVRGAQIKLTEQRPRLGIIPACAGSTAKRLFPNFIPRDHPRMCGEHQVLRHYSSSSLGSSPHVRGAHSGRMVYYRSNGIIPACAGSTWGFVTWW